MYMYVGGRVCLWVRGALDYRCVAGHTEKAGLIAMQCDIFMVRVCCMHTLSIQSHEIAGVTVAPCKFTFLIGHGDYGIETRSGSLSESVSILLSKTQGDFEDNCTEEQLAKSTGLVHPDRCANDYAIKVRIRTSNRIT